MNYHSNQLSWIVTYQMLTQKNCNRLTTVVFYRTKYMKPDGTNMTLAFELGESISVNAVIRLPNFKE